MVLPDAAIEAIGGAVGASVSLAATYPLLIVSTWQALEHSNNAPVNEEITRRFRFFPSPLKELCIQVEERGLKSLFVGLQPSIFGTAVSQAVYFYIYSSLRGLAVDRKKALDAAAGRVTSSAVDSRSESIGLMSSMAVALLAGCGNVLATTPLWVVVTQMQAEQRFGATSRASSSNSLNGAVEQPRCRSIWEVASDVFNESGLAGFWKGVSPSLVMVSNPTLQYIMYEYLTGRLRKTRAAKTGAQASSIRLRALDAFLLTAAAKLGATLLTYPMLLIKSRMQAANSNTASELRYTGVLDAVFSIVRREGLGGLYKGIRLKLLQTVLAAALLMAIKEEVYSAVKTSAGLFNTAGVKSRSKISLKTLGRAVALAAALASVTK